MLTIIGSCVLCLSIRQKVIDTTKPWFLTQVCRYHARQFN